MAGCGSHCGWCGSCSLALDADDIERICPECGADLGVERHDEDCGESAKGEGEDDADF